MAIQRFLFASSFVVIFSSIAYSQFSRVGVGGGINLQFGLNPKVEYLEWVGEDIQLILMPQKRFMVGPMIQWKNYQKVQAEMGITYGRVIFKSPTVGFIDNRDMIAEDWQAPVYLVLNTKSPIRYHSAIVYKTGFVTRLTHFQANESLTRGYTFFTPAFTAGIYLATELQWYGRFEYGLTYSKNLREKHVMYVENIDSPPSSITYTEKIGQLRASLTYFFTPKVRHWSKKNYGLAEIEY
ncbi:MAG: hypothetical protein OEY51_01215 [Cyclobacteriaceae bacterium]|nr:hypothetical protein [Cyclobacteriaceae bacterium]